MAFQKPLPEWKQPGIRPPESKIKEGYQVLDKPPAAWMNWQMNTTYEALQELQEKAAEKEDVSEALGEAKAYTDEKISSIDAPVRSVNNKTGDVVLTAADIAGDNGDFSVPGNITSGKQVSATGGFVTPKDVHARDIATSRNLVVSGETNLSSRVFMAAPPDASINPELWFFKGDVKRGVLWTSMAGNFNSINLRPQKSDGSNAPGLALTEDGRMMYNGRDVMAEIDSAKQSGVDARSKIAGAINAKGVPASANDTFEQLAQKISSIRVGSQVRYVPIDFHEVSSRRVYEKEQSGTVTYKLADVPFEHALLGIDGFLNVECEHIHSWRSSVSAECGFYLADQADNRFFLVSVGHADDSRKSLTQSRSLFKVSTTNRRYEAMTHEFPYREPKIISVSIPETFQLTGPLRLMCEFKFYYGVGNDYEAKLTANFKGTLLLV